MLASLERELQPLWLARDHPSVAFSIYGKHRGLTRDKAILGDVDGTVSPLYRYGSPEMAHVHPWTPTTREIRDLIEANTGIRCTHLVANRYSANDKIGAHRDKDRDFSEPDYSIVTVSLGATRRLLLRDGNNEVATTLQMQHGSAYRLNHATNKAFKHEVPAMPKRKVPAGSEQDEPNPATWPFRIGLTYRTVATRYDSVTKEIIMQDGKREKLKERDSTANKDKRESKPAKSTAKRQKRERAAEEEEETIVTLKQATSTANNDKRENKPRTRTAQRQERENKAEEDAMIYL